MADGTAIIADPRNDENIDHLRAAVRRSSSSTTRRRPRPRAAGTGDAQRACSRRPAGSTTWHYQWIDPARVPAADRRPADWSTTSRARAAASTGRRAARRFIPVEFQARRLPLRAQHGAARPTAPTSPATTASRSSASSSIPSQEGAADPATCAAAPRAARRFVGWQTFFDFGDGQVKPNKRIDTKISTPLFHLPLGAIASHDAAHGAAAAQPAAAPHVELPSGQSVARAHGRHAARRRTTSTELAPLDVGFERRRRSGTTSSRRRSRRGRASPRPGRRPHRRRGLPRPAAIATRPRTSSASRAGSPRCPRRTATFRMTDFLTFAGVDPALARPVDADRPAVSLSVQDML